MRGELVSLPREKFPSIRNRLGGVREGGVRGRGGRRREQTSEERSCSTCSSVIAGPCFMFILARMFLCERRWVYHFSFCPHHHHHHPTPLLSLCLAPHCSVLLVGRVHASTHTHTHTLPPVGSSVCVCCHQTQGLIISAPTPLTSSSSSSSTYT